MKIIFLLIALVFSSHVISQNQIIKSFITKDSLIEISILKNSKVAYIKYSGISPIMDLSRNRYKKRFCPPSFVYEEKGYGKYEIKNDSIVLAFIPNPRDSVRTELLGKQKMGLINVIFATKNEIYGGAASGYLQVRFEQNGVTLDNFYSGKNEIEIELSKCQLPQVFIVNDRERIIVDEFRNQRIFYYENHFKAGLTQMPKKSFVISNLIEVKE